MTEERFDKFPLAVIALAALANLGCLGLIVGGILLLGGVL